MVVVRNQKAANAGDVRKRGFDPWARNPGEKRNTVPYTLAPGESMNRRASLAVVHGHKVRRDFGN